MLVAKPTTLSGVFAACDELTSAHPPAGSTDYLLPTAASAG
jgi:hypothetical protein